MITYYRTYYDSRLIDIYGNIGYLYITKQLPKQELSQSELADFISSNPNDVLFKYQLGRDIYAISRYCISTKGIRVPIDKENLLDLFIFPSIVKNKSPFSVSTSNVGTTLPRTIRSEIENFSIYILPYLDNLVTNETMWENFSEFYRKARLGLLNINLSTVNLYGQTDNNIGLYLPKINKPLIEKLTIKSLSIKNTNRIKPISNIYYQMNQELRCVDESDYIFLNEEEKSQVRVDFSSLETIKLFDFNDLNKVDSYGMQLKHYQNYSKFSGSYVYYYKGTREFGGHINFMSPVNGSQNDEDYFFGAYNTQIIKLRTRHTNAYSEYPKQEISGINLLDTTDLSGMDLDYLSDKTYFSLINKFETWENDSVMKMYDSSFLDLQKIKSWINTGIYDTTSWFFNELDITDHTYAIDSSSQINGAEYQFSINGLKGYITKNSKLAPIKIKSQIVQDFFGFQSTDFSQVTEGDYVSNLQAILSIQSLTKETMDWLNSNNYSNTYEWLLTHLTDLTNIKTNNHFFAYYIPCDNVANIYYKTLYRKQDLTNQEVFSFDDSNLLTFTTIQQRVFINQQEGQQGYQGGVPYNGNIGNKITLSKFVTRYTHNLVDPYQSLSKQNVGVETTTDRSVYLYDGSMNLLTSFQYTPRYINDSGSYVRTTQINYSCDHSTLVLDDLTTICQNWVNDASHYCTQNVINYIYGLEESLVINDVPMVPKQEGFGKEFKFNDLYTSHIFSYVDNTVFILPIVRGTCQAIAETLKLTQGKSAKQVWNQTTEPIRGGLSPEIHTPRVSHFYPYGEYLKNLVTTRAGGVNYTASSWQYHLHTYHGYHEVFIPTSRADQQIGGPPEYDDVTYINTDSMFNEALTGYGEHDSEYQYKTAPLYDTSNVLTRCHINLLSNTYVDMASDGNLILPRSIEPNFHIPYYEDILYQSGSQSVAVPNMHELCSKIGDIFTSMTPFDLIVKNDSTTFTRMLSNLSPYQKWGRQLEYKVSNIDTTRYLPTSFIINDKMVEHFNKLGRNISSEYINKIKSHGYFMSKIQSSGNYKFELNPSLGNYIQKYNIYNNLKIIPIDYTNSIIYFEPESYNEIDYPTQNTSIEINNSRYNYHYRTPISGYLTNLTDITMLKHNAILDYILLKLNTDSSGYILPFKEISDIYSFNYESLGIDQTPHQNKTLLVEPGDVSVFVMGDMMCVNDIEHIDEILINDTSIKIDFTKYTGVSCSRNLGEPIIYFIDDANFTDTTINIVDLAYSDKFANFGFPDLRYSFAGTKNNFLNVINYSVNLIYNVEKQDFTINKISDQTEKINKIDFVNYVPTLTDVATSPTISPLSFNTFTSVNQKYYYKGTNFSEPTGYSSPQSGMKLNISNYDFENSNIYLDNTIYRYIIDRLSVDQSNIIHFYDVWQIQGTATKFENFISNCIIEANNLEGLYITPYDLLSMIMDDTYYYVIKSNMSYIIIDRYNNKIYTIYSHKYYASYKNFNCSSVDFSNNFDNIIQPILIDYNVYMQDVYKIDHGNTYMGALIDDINLISTNPYGNMYILSDYSQLMMQETLKELLNTF